MPRPCPKKWIFGPADLEAIKQGCYFDESEGRRVCDFIEQFCRQSQDEWEGQLIVLMPWQRQFLMRLFGWRQKI